MRISDIPVLQKLRSKIVFNRNVAERLSVPDAQLIVSVLRDDLKAARAEVVRANMVTRIVAAAAVVAEIATVYLLVR